jgi:hypothetical protein
MGYARSPPHACEDGVCEARHNTLKIKFGYLGTVWSELPPDFCVRVLVQRTVPLYLLCASCAM